VNTETVIPCNTYKFGSFTRIEYCQNGCEYSVFKCDLNKLYPDVMMHILTMLVQMHNKPLVISDRFGSFSPKT